MLPGDADLPEPARTQPENQASVPFRAAPRVVAATGEALLQHLRPNPPGLAPTFSSGPDAQALLKALGRRWLLAVTLGLIGAIAAGSAAWLLLGAKYTVFAQMRVASTAPRMVFNVADRSEGRDFNTYMRTAAAALKSRFVLNAALKKDEVKRLRMVSQQPDPIAWLEDELKVEYKDNSEIVSLAISGEDPDEMVLLINAVTQSYLTEVVNEERKVRSDRVAELDDIATKSKDNLRTKRETLRKRADELGTSDSQALTQRQLMLISNLGELRRQQSQVHFDLMKSEAKLIAYKGRIKAAPTQAEIDAVVNEALIVDPKIAGLTNRSTALQKLVTEYEHTSVLKNETSLLRSRALLENTKKDLDARKTELKAQLAERIQQKAKAEFESGMAQLQDEVSLLKEQEKSLLAQLLSMEKDAGKIGHSSTELEMLRGEIKQEESIAERVGGELEALKVELRSPPRVSLYQEAGVQRKDMKKQIVMTALAPLAVLLAVCFLVAWFECRSRRIHSADEVVRGLGIRVVGAIPALPGLMQLSLAGDDTDGQNQVESVDAIRTMLLRDASLEKTRLIMVTSATDREGKTALASHLAGSLARAGRRTLLVDCDLRTPAVHQLFELPMQPGFSEALLGEIAVDDAIQETSIDGLWILAAGQWDREVIQALAKEGVESLFERFKEQFDFVVIDSHPVLSATDSLLIGQHVDAVLLSLLKDVSQTPRVYAAGQRLSTLGIRVLGAVVNGMPQEDLYSNTYHAPAEAVG